MSREAGHIVLRDFVVRYAVNGKSFNEIAREYKRQSDRCRERFIERSNVPVPPLCRRLFKVIIPYVSVQTTKGIAYRCKIKSLHGHFVLQFSSVSRAMPEPFTSCSDNDIGGKLT
jgi:hypothetical protein